MINILENNISEIQQNISTACLNSNRLLTEVTPICVSKTVPFEQIQSVYLLGLRHFAENRPQIFMDKVHNLKENCPDIQWHFIGNLQRRRVKQIIDHIDYLHSLDRLSLAHEIQKRASQPVKCFIQVNLSGEASKSGFTGDELREALPELLDLDRLNILGLMTMAPIDASDSQLHALFAETRELLHALHLEFPVGQFGNELSMGMSRDYPQAISEGATYVRIGTAFFKDHPHPQS